VPKANVQLLDTWKTRGMRGTGTHHFEVKDVFVPERRTVLTSRDTLTNDGARYRIPQTLTFAAGDAIVALTVARNCLNAFFELAGVKAPRNLTGLLRDQAISQFNVGQVEAQIRSGRAFLMETVHDIWNESVQTGAVSIQRRVDLRLSATHAVRLAAQAVETIYTLSGGNAIFEGDIIQRYFQDIHVITQHTQGRLAHYELVGTHLLGIPIESNRL
jgi:alkylation response protein AidB-like acyl-CoA dehydrogenase